MRFLGPGCRFWVLAAIILVLAGSPAMAGGISLVDWNMRGEGTRGAATSPTIMVRPEVYLASVPVPVVAGGPLSVLEGLAVSLVGYGRSGAKTDAELTIWMKRLEAARVATADRVDSASTLSMIDHIESLFRLDHALARGDQDACRAVLARMLNASPTDSRAVVDRGVLAHALSEHGAALHSLSFLVDCANRGDHETLILLARSALAAGDRGLARRAVFSALRTREGGAEAGSADGVTAMITLLRIRSEFKALLDEAV